MLSLLEFLKGYTAEHFREEEKLMSGVDYPRLAAQEKAHAAFIEDFVRLKGLVDEYGPSLENMLSEKRSMIQWLINHIRHMDREFAAYLVSRQLN